MIVIEFPNDAKRDPVKCILDFKPTVGERIMLDGQIIDIDGVLLHANPTYSEPAATVTMLGMVDPAWPLGLTEDDLEGNEQAP
jgi:hypothetical protein